MNLKKLYLFCIIIIIFGVVINIVLMNHTHKVPTNNQTPKNQVSTHKQTLKRPIAYMINNIPEALPQSGIYGADYVYEMLVEGGITRLMTVFDNPIPDRIGPIRSARHNFLDIAMEYNAVYAHFGGSPKAFEDIKTLKIPNLNGIQLDGKMYWRDKKRKAPHNSYTNIEKTLEYSKNFGYDTDVTDNHFKFAPDENINGNSAVSVHIPYNISHYIDYYYDNTSKLYKRYMRGKEHIDEANNKVLSAKNIIIEFARNTTMDNANRQEIYLVGTGRGMFITNGQYIDITWQKNSRSEITHYYKSDGEEIILNIGQTWIQIVPVEAKVEIK